MQIKDIFINTSAIRGLGANTAEIAQKRRGCLASEPLVPKHRVWVSVYKGLSDFCPEFSQKKSIAQFAFGFGCTAPRPDWVQNRGSSHVPSRLKGIETQFIPPSLTFVRVKVHTCLPV